MRADRLAENILLAQFLIQQFLIQTFTANAYIIHWDCIDFHV